MQQGPLPEAGGFCFRPSAQKAGFVAYIPGGLPPVIRFGGTFQPIPVALRAIQVFFVFVLQLSKLASD